MWTLLAKLLPIPKFEIDAALLRLLVLVASHCLVGAGALIACSMGSDRSAEIAALKTQAAALNQELDNERERAAILERAREHAAETLAERESEISAQSARAHALLAELRDLRRLDDRHPGIGGWSTRWLRAKSERLGFDVINTPPAPERKPNRSGDSDAMSENIGERRGGIFPDG